MSSVERGPRLLKEALPKFKEEPIDDNEQAVVGGTEFKEEPIDKNEHEGFLKSTENEEIQAEDNQESHASEREMLEEMGREHFSVVRGVGAEEGGSGGEGGAASSSSTGAASVQRPPTVSALCVSRHILNRLLKQTSANFDRMEAHKINALALEPLRSASVMRRRIENGIQQRNRPEKRKCDEAPDRKRHPAKKSP